MSESNAGSAGSAGAGWPSTAAVAAKMDGAPLDTGGGSGAADAAAEPAAAAPAAPVAPAPAAPVAEPAAEADPFDDPASESFTRGYVEKIRKERRQAQERAKRYDDVFSRYDEQSQGAWLQLQEAWADGREREVVDYLAELLSGDTPQPDVAAQGAPDDGYDAAAGAASLTEADVARMVEERIADRDRQATERASVQGVYDEIHAADIGGARIEPDSIEEAMVLRLASKTAQAGGTDGDVAAAVEKVRAYRQSVIDSFVADKQAGGGPSATPAQGAQAVQDAGPATEWPTVKEVQRRLDARSASQPGH